MNHLNKNFSICVQTAGCSDAGGSSLPHLRVPVHGPEEVPGFYSLWTVHGPNASEGNCIVTLNGLTIHLCKTFYILLSFTLQWIRLLPLINWQNACSPGSGMFSFLFTASSKLYIKWKEKRPERFKIKSKWKSRQKNGMAGSDVFVSHWQRSRRKNGDLYSSQWLWTSAMNLVSCFLIPVVESWCKWPIFI